MSDGYQRAIRVDDLAPNAARCAMVGNWPVLVARSGDDFHAMLNRCSHAAASLEGGKVRRGVIFCPLHGAPFRLDTGICMATASRYPDIPVFPIRIVDGWVEVELPPREPAADELPVQTV